MCLAINIDQAVVHIADEDMIVYKVITRKVDTGDYHAIFKNYTYSLTDVMVANKFNETVESIKIFNEVFESIKRLYYGFHSYVHVHDATYLVRRCAVYKKSAGWYANVELLVAKCMVPKGTRYVRGTNDDLDENILSEKLKIIEFVNT